MAMVTKPPMLDETGKALVAAIQGLAAGGGSGTGETGGVDSGTVTELREGILAAQETADGAAAAAQAAQETAQQALEGLPVVDTSVTEGSGNPVSGGAVYAALADKANAPAPLEPADDDIPSIWLEGEEPTYTVATDEDGYKYAVKDEVDVVAHYRSRTMSYDTDAATIKVQGDWSLTSAKKNYTLKVPKKQKINFRGWGEERKFVLKSCADDGTHCRNLMAAGLWKDMVRSREDYDTLPEAYRNSQLGSVDGFVCRVYYNGAYKGLYDLTYPKSDKFLGMDCEKNLNQVILQSCFPWLVSYRTELGQPKAFNFRALWDGTGRQHSYWELEAGYKLDPETGDAVEGISDTAVTGLNALIACVKDTTDAEFLAQIEEHLDVASAIDVYILLRLIFNTDCLGKNQLIYSWDGGAKWAYAAYDLGLCMHSTGDFETANGESYNLLFERLWNLMPDRVRARYQALRQTVLTPQRIISYITTMQELIGKERYTAEKNTQYNPATVSTETIASLSTYVLNRLATCDKEYQAMAPHIMCTGLTITGDASAMVVGDKRQLGVTAVPANHTEKLGWVSSNTGVATVSTAGLVTAVASGSATITVRTPIAYEGAYAVTASRSLLVQSEQATKPCTAISFGAASYDVTEAQSITLTPIVTPSDTDDTLVWSVDDSSIATVAGGVVTGAKAGTTVVTVACGTQSATCSVVVAAREKRTVWAWEGDTATLPEGGTATNLSTVQLGGRYAVTYDNDLFAAGTAVESTLVIEDSRSDEGILEVEAVLSALPHTALSGNNIAIRAYEESNDAVSEVVYYGSYWRDSGTFSNMCGASVGNMQLIGIQIHGATSSIYNTTRTVMTDALDKAMPFVYNSHVRFGANTAFVTAIRWFRSAADVCCTGVQFSASSAVLQTGETLTLTVTVKPYCLEDRTVTWSSTDESVATVVDGVVTAVGNGSAKIRASHGNVYGELALTVAEPALVADYNLTGTAGETIPTVVHNTVDSTTNPLVLEGFTTYNAAGGIACPNDAAVVLMQAPTLPASGRIELTCTGISGTQYQGYAKLLCAYGSGKETMQTMLNGAASRFRAEMVSAMGALSKYETNPGTIPAKAVMTLCYTPNAYRVLMRCYNASGAELTAGALDSPSFNSALFADVATLTFGNNTDRNRGLNATLAGIKVYDYGA